MCANDVFSDFIVCLFFFHPWTGKEKRMASLSFKTDVVFSLTSETNPSLFLSKLFKKKLEDFTCFMKTSLLRFPSWPASCFTLHRADGFTNFTFLIKSIWIFLTIIFSYFHDKRSCCIPHFTFTYLSVSLLLTTIPWSSNIPKYSGRDIFPLLSWTTWTSRWW